MNVGGKSVRLNVAVELANKCDTFDGDIYSLSQKDEVRERLWAMGYGLWAILTFSRTALKVFT